MTSLRVTYHLEVEAAEAPARAAEVALEQTVEVPRSAVTDPMIEGEVMGRVESLEADPAGGFRAVIAYPLETTALDPAQLLNVVFGNSSLHADCRCVDLEAPIELLDAMGGPRFGIEGIRKAAGIYDRPLTCTAIKPMGLSTPTLADLCETFARGGIDVIKDDHGLADQQWSRLEERIPACLAACERAADATGHRALYVPNLIGSPERVLRALRFAEACGARAVMVSPMLLGLPFFWELCQRHASVPVLAHPAFAGVLRLGPELLFGKLLRLFGADAVIYVNFGSRFHRSREECARLAGYLRDPWGPMRPSMPVPAGGIQLGNAADVVSFYGTDSMLLIGGDLQKQPGAVADRTERFVDTVRSAAQRSSR